MQTNHTAQTFPYETGCYLDNHRGHYIVRDVILFAESEAGFQLDDEARALVDAYDAECHDPGYDYEALVDISDEAINWLNEQTCGRPDDTYWGWFDGDFGLYADDEF